MNEQNSDTARKVSPLFTALLRLALLVVPSIALVKMLGHSPVICALALAGFLAVWFNVDVWPFRPRTNRRAEIAVAPVKSTATELVTHHFCRLLFLMVLFHSRLPV